MNRSKAAILLALAAAFIAGCIVPNRKAGPARSCRTGGTPGLDVARQLNEAFVSVAEKVSPSVVVLEVTEKPAREDGAAVAEAFRGRGVGHHCHQGRLYSDQPSHRGQCREDSGVSQRWTEPFAGEVRGTDPKTDIAVVKIDTEGRDLPVAKLGDSDKLRVGEFVVAIGHPLELTYSVTVGHVSAIARQLPTDSYANISDDQEYIQTDAVINPGNSGGPLINLNGEVVAVNAMMEGSVDPITGFTQNRGIGLAIPINEARVVKDRLISDGKITRSIIGIVMAQQSRDRAEHSGPGRRERGRGDAQRSRRQSRFEDQRPHCRGGRNAGENRAGLAQSSGAQEAGPKHHHQRAARQERQAAPIKVVTEAEPAPGGGNPGVHLLRAGPTRRSAPRNPIMVLQPRR